MRGGARLRRVTPRIVNHQLSADGWQTFSPRRKVMAAEIGKMHLDSIGKMHIDTIGKMH